MDWFQSVIRNRIWISQLLSCECQVNKLHISLSWFSSTRTENIVFKVYLECLINWWVANSYLYIIMKMTDCNVSITMNNWSIILVFCFQLPICDNIWSSWRFQILWSRWGKGCCCWEGNDCPGSLSIVARSFHLATLLLESTNWFTNNSALKYQWRIHPSGIIRRFMISVSFRCTLTACIVVLQRFQVVSLSF